MKVCLSRNGDEAAGRERPLRGTRDSRYDKCFGNTLTRTGAGN